MKIVFFGSSGYVLPVIEKLKRNFEIELVVTTEKADGVVPKFCNEHSLPYLSVQSLSDQNTKYKILNTKSELGVLADFGLIVPNEVLNKFVKGILNIHPSLLPKYRGPTPVQTAILNNEKETGVSIIKLDNEIDHGPILAQVREEIKQNDTAQSLYERLFEIGGNLICQNIKHYIKGKLKLTEQGHEKATFTKIFTRQDGYIDLSSLEIGNWKLEIERKIRAFFPWPGVWTRSMINARPGRNRRGKLSIIKFLPQKKLQVEGKKPVSYKDFINGYPNLDKRILSILNK